MIKVDKPLNFINGRKLLYLNRQNLSTPFLITSHLTLPMIYVGYLIKNNPCTLFDNKVYLTFPAALPIMIFIEFGLFAKYCFHKAHYKYHVERIYLYDDGVHVEFIFANKIRTALKDREKKLVHPLFALANPIEDEYNLPLKGKQFPRSKDKI